MLSNSARITALEAKLEERMKADNQIRLAIADIYNKMPPDGKTVAGYVGERQGGSGAVDVVAALAALDIYVDDGRMSIGWPIDYKTQACFQIGGRVAAEIQGRSNDNRTDGQNPNEPHLNTMVICDNDGSWSVRQYCKWWNGAVRNTSSRQYTRLSIDSKGDFCCSDDRWPKGQVWYIRKSEGFVDFCAYQVGMIVRILKSIAGYGAADNQQL